VKNHTAEFAQGAAPQGQNNRACAVPLLQRIMSSAVRLKIITFYDTYFAFFTSGHLDSDNGWNAWSAGIVATSL
jgi:hypothetical protein